MRAIRVVRARHRQHDRPRVLDHTRRRRAELKLRRDADDRLRTGLKDDRAAERESVEGEADIRHAKPHEPRRLDGAEEIENRVGWPDGRRHVAVIMMTDPRERNCPGRVVVKSLEHRGRPRLDLLEQSRDRPARDRRKTAGAMHRPLDAIEIARLRIERCRRAVHIHAVAVAKILAGQRDDARLRRLRRAEEHCAKQREHEEECFSASRARRR